MTPPCLQVLHVVQEGRHHGPVQGTGALRGHPAAAEQHSAEEWVYIPVDRAALGNWPVEERSESDEEGGAGGREQSSKA